MENRNPAEILIRTQSTLDIEQTEIFQQVVITQLRKERAVIESCPSSNYILSGISRMEDHPLPALLRSGLYVVISSDDPGFFQTNYKKEEEFCREKLNLTTKDLQELRKNALSLFQHIDIHAGTDIGKINF